MVRYSAKFLALVAVLIAATPWRASAAEFTLNLAGDRKVTIPVAPQDLRFVLVNRLPTGTYAIAVSSKIIPIPNLGTFTVPGGLSAGECDAIAVEVDRLGKATDEKAVAGITPTLRNLITGGKCTDQAVLRAGNAALASTISLVEGTFPVSYGTIVTVLVSRGTETWEFVFDGGSRGEWLATYGFAISTSDDEGYFAKEAGPDKFVVTKQHVPDEKELDLAPSVYYTWLPRRYANRNFSPGITAGLGITDDSPGLFLGLSVLHNWNMQLAAGVSIFKQQRLDRNYTPDQELKEFVPPDKLNTGVFKPAFSISLSLRFGGNPFAKAEGGEAGEETPAEGAKPAGGAKPEGTKPAEGAKPADKKSGSH